MINRRDYDPPFGTAPPPLSPTALCGHRWQKPPPKPNGRHRCQLDPDHTDRCRCRCGATTTREDR